MNQGQFEFCEIRVSDGLIPSFCQDLSEIEVGFRKRVEKQQGWGSKFVDLWWSTIGEDGGAAISRRPLFSEVIGEDGRSCREREIQGKNDERESESLK